uniref:Uncharacterized protein n=1 Tax=Tanacetum cinerariifolium TaxID=118510 RepID=A0A699KKE6_TANCI|nr:hypothetical protein [Tanacetum cinerariifolium]
MPHVEYAPAVYQYSEFSSPDTGLVVPVFQKGDDPIDAINYMMSFLTSVVISSDEWKSFQSQHQTALRIRRWHYNLTPAESKFKTPMLDHQDKYMMKAQVHVLKSSAISDIQPLPRRKHYC